MFIGDYFISKGPPAFYSQVIGSVRAGLWIYVVRGSNQAKVDWFIGACELKRAHR